MGTDFVLDLANNRKKSYNQLEPVMKNMPSVHTIAQKLIFVTFKKHAKKFKSYVPYRNLRCIATIHIP